MQNTYLRSLFKAGVLFILYFVTARIGLSLNAVSGFATFLSLPTGIALAALVLFGYRFWPAIMLAAFLVNFITGVPLFAALGIGIGNTLEPLVGAYLLKRFVGFQTTLNRLQDVLGLALLAAFLSTLIGAMIGVSSLFFSGIVFSSSYPATWLAWWMRDMLGDLIIAPFLLVWSRRQPSSLPTDKVLEIGIAMVTLILISLIVFGNIVSLGSPLTYLVFPPLIWIALRFREREVATAILVVSIIVVSGTIAGLGPFATENLRQGLLSLQIFLAVLAITTLILAAIVSAERKQIEVFRDEMYENKLESAKDEFISLVSHELRTPMTAIKGLVSMLLHGDYGPVNESCKQPLTNVYTSAERQIHMINDLLNISRLQTGRIRYTLTNFPIGQIIDEITESLQPLARQKKITLTVKNGRGMLVLADTIWVKQILGNLIDNAMKFTNTGSVAISYRVQHDMVHVVIADTGVGINPMDQNKLFGKFQSLSLQSLGKTGGSGLCLYFSQEITHKMGGYISLLKSSPGKGSTFIFALPKADSLYAEKIKAEHEKEVAFAFKQKTA